MYLLNKILPLFFIIVLTSLLSCSRYIKSIDDKRIPDSVKTELNKIRYSQIVRDTVFSTSNFVLKEKYKMQSVTILRTITYKPDSTIRIRYKFFHTKFYPLTEFWMNPIVNLDESVTKQSTQSFSKKIRYVCTHTTNKHSTYNPAEVKVLTQKYGCPSWDTVFEER
jgi:hypothetical protein